MEPDRRSVLLPPRRQPAGRRGGLRPPVPVPAVRAPDAGGRPPAGVHDPAVRLLVARAAQLLPPPGDRLRARRHGRAGHGVAGRRIAGERVGLLVAAMAALSPNLFYFDAMVVSETMVVATTAAILLAAYRWWDAPTPGNALVFGLVIGVAALVRSEAVLLGPMIAVPLVWWRRGGRGAGPGVAGLARPARGWPASAAGSCDRPVGVLQHVPVRGAGHPLGPVRPDPRHRQLRGGVLRRPGRLLVAGVHPGHRAPGAGGRRVGPGQGVPRDRLRLRR